MHTINHILNYSLYFVAFSVLFVFITHILWTFLQKKYRVIQKANLWAREQCSRLSDRSADDRECWRREFRHWRRLLFAYHCEAASDPSVARVTSRTALLNNHRMTELSAVHCCENHLYIGRKHSKSTKCHTATVCNFVISMLYKDF